MSYPAHTWALFMQAFVCLILCKRVVSVISLGTVITLYNQSVRLKVFRNGSVRKPGCCTCIRVACCCLEEWNGCIAACLCDCLNLRSSERNKCQELFSHMGPDCSVLPGALQMRCCSFISVCTLNAFPYCC